MVDRDRALSGEASSAGLVSSSTTHPGGFFIPFGAAATQLRRHKRLKQCVWNAAHWFELYRKAERLRVWFITLTYRTVEDWRANHIRGFFNRASKWARQNEARLRYVWVAELQKRGAIHYHVAFWLPRALAFPKPDKAGWWPHGSTSREIARSPVGYLMKYASKGDAYDRFPKGARIFGVGGLCSDGRAVGSWLGLPEWAKRLRGVGQVQRRASRLVVPQTGELLASPFVPERRQAGVWLRREGELAPRWFSGPYSLIGKAGQ